jgi:hypothetical protein
MASPDRSALRVVPIFVATGFLVVLALVTATPGRATTPSSALNCPYGDCVSPSPVSFFQTMAGEALIGGILAAAVVTLLIVHPLRAKPGKKGGDGNSPGGYRTSDSSYPPPPEETDRDAPENSASCLEPAVYPECGAKSLWASRVITPERA